MVKNWVLALWVQFPDHPLYWMVTRVPIWPNYGVTYISLFRGSAECRVQRYAWGNLVPDGDTLFRILSGIWLQTSLKGYNPPKKFLSYITLKIYSILVDRRKNERNSTIFHRFMKFLTNHLFNHFWPPIFLLFRVLSGVNSIFRTMSAIRREENDESWSLFLRLY